jgi:hypothetical protein
LGQALIHRGRETPGILPQLHPDDHANDWPSPATFLPDLPESNLE